jgi:hypothetical protein
MFGYYALVTPLAVLAIALLFRFVGCSSTATGSGPLLFQLNMDPDLQKPVAGDTREVKNIAVFWSVWDGGSLLRTVPVPPTVINPLDPDFLDPTLDKGAEYSATAFDLASANHVSCTCVLTLGVPAGSAPDESETVHSTSLPLVAGHGNYVFTLTAKAPKTAGAKRDFVLREYSV